MSTMDTRSTASRDLTAWTGWIGFAAILLTLIGSITFFEGLVAIIRDEYYVVTGQQVLVFDLTTWGWIMLFWGILLFFAGFGTCGEGRLGTLVHDRRGLGSTSWLSSASSATRSTRSGRSSSSALEIVVLFALTARWGEAHMFE